MNIYSVRLAVSGWKADYTVHAASFLQAIDEATRRAEATGYKVDRVIKVVQQA